MSSQGSSTDLPKAGFPCPTRFSGDHRKLDFKDSDELCEYVRGLYGPDVILYFSTGKDSLACWLQLQKHKFRVHPVYRYYIPGEEPGRTLDFVEQTLAYYEDFFGAKVERWPHQQYLHQIDQLVFQHPARVKPLDDLVIVRDYYTSEMTDSMRRRLGIHDAWSAQGIRITDSMHRRNMIKRMGGPLNWEAATFFPVFDWSYDRMTQEFDAAKLKLPIDYRIWNRSFDSIRGRFLPGLKAHFPKDWARLKFLFPFIEAETWRFKFYEEGEP